MRTFTTPIAMAVLSGAMWLSAMGSASATCGALPNVDWWTSTHEEVQSLIGKKYSGNWDPYITQWKQYMSRMQQIQARDGVAEVKSRGLALKGPSLSRHISDIQQRIQVLECLKSESLSASNSIEIPTASGSESSPTDQGSSAYVLKAPEYEQPVEVGTSTKDVSDKEQLAGNDAVREGKAGSGLVASISEGDFELEVTARCDKGQPVFQVTNLGDRWPRLGAISIHRTDNDGMLSKRRLRLANSQQATFKIRQRQSADVGEIGIWIEPSWFQRPFSYDAKIACN